MLANLDDYGGEVFAPTMVRLRAGDKESESAKIVVQPRAYADYSHVC